MSLYKLFDFPKGGIGIAKIAFYIERLCYGRIFLIEFRGTFFAVFFPSVFFY